MRLIGFTGAIAALFLTAIGARAGAAPVVPKAGDTYEITMTRDSVQQGSQGSSGNSHDNDALAERVIGVRADGLELEYDLPKSATADDRASEWQFPVRVFKPFSGPMQLLNGPELEARVDSWLKAGGLSRAECGHWIFTWNAFRIECDPQAVIQTLEAFDLDATPVYDGASYRDPAAAAPGTLTRKASGRNGASFTVEIPVDPDAVRHARAESDVVAGDILKKPVTLDAALSERAKETISGTISVTFETDAAGTVRRRMKVTTLDTKEPDGRSETETVTETLERHRIAQ